MSRTRAVAAAFALVMVPALAACQSGQNAETTQQGWSGNGAYIEAGDLILSDATLVAGNPGSGRAAFLGTVVNNSTEADAVLGIAANGGRAKLLPEPIPVPARSAVSIQTGKAAQAGFLGLDAAPGQYVDVTVLFQRAGQAQFPALLVPPTGFYLEAAPVGTRPILRQLQEQVAQETLEQSK